MAERKETGAGMRRMSEIVVVLLVSLAAGLLAAMLVGMGAAALTVRGSVRVTQLTGAALGALFLAGLTAGLLCLRKMLAQNAANQCRRWRSAKLRLCV